MIDKRSECSKCGHSAVCAYKVHYRDFYDAVRRATKYGELVEDKNVFFVLTECSQWIPIRQNVRPQLDILQGPVNE